MSYTLYDDCYEGNPDYCKYGVTVYHRQTPPFGKCRNEPARSYVLSRSHRVIYHLVLFYHVFPLSSIRFISLLDTFYVKLPLISINYYDIILMR